VPDCNVLETRMFLPDCINRALQTLREGIRLSFEVYPPKLKLPRAFVVDILPVVIDDQVGYLDIRRRELVKCIINLLVRQSLPKTIPCA